MATGYVKKIIIVIDKPCSNFSYNLDKINVLRFTNEFYDSNHANQVACSFTKFNKFVNLCFSDLTEKNLIKVFKYFYPVKEQCKIYLPFGNFYLQKKLEKIIKRYPKNTVFVSSPNSHTKPQMYPSISENTQVISATSSNSKVNKILSLYKKKLVVVKTKKNISNSLILGYHNFLHSKSLINTHGETFMTDWNFENNHVFHVAPKQLFAFQLTEENIKLVDSHDSVFIDDGFIYGTVDESTSITVDYNGELRTYVFEVYQHNYQEEALQFMPAKNPGPVEEDDPPPQVFFEDGTPTKQSQDPKNQFYQSGVPYTGPIGPTAAGYNPPDGSGSLQRYFDYFKSISPKFMG